MVPKRMSSFSYLRQSPNPVHGEFRVLHFLESCSKVKSSWGYWFLRKSNTSPVSQVMSYFGIVYKLKYACEFSIFV